jgi:hypothetical protein
MGPHLPAPADHHAAELFQGREPDIPFVDPASVNRAKREDMSQQGQLI